MEEKIKAELAKIAKEGKVPCAMALELAKSLGCEASVVGKVADELKIKVVACSLGCF